MRDRRIGAFLLAAGRSRSIPTAPEAFMQTLVHPRVRRRGVALWVLLAAALPLAFLGLVSHANEYRSWGGSGVDCDGPALLMFAWPAAVVYTFGALVFIRRAIRRFRVGPALAAVLCVLLVVGLAANIRAAHRELNDPGYRLVCEGR